MLTKVLSLQQSLSINETLISGEILKVNTVPTLIALWIMIKTMLTNGQHVLSVTSKTGIMM